MKTKYKKQIKRSWYIFISNIIHILHWSKFENRCNLYNLFNKKSFKYKFKHSINDDLDDEFKIESIAKQYGYNIVNENLTSKISEYTFKR